MKIDERTVGDVVILDLHGKILIGEGDDALREAVNRLADGGKTKILLNLADVPYVDSAGLGEIVRCYTTVSQQGREAEAPEPHGQDPRPPGDHQAADRLRDLRLRGGRRQELLACLPRAARAGASPVRPPPHDDLPPRGVHFPPAAPVDEEPAGLRRPGLLQAPLRGRRPPPHPRGVRGVLRPLWRRVPGQRRRRPGAGPAAPAQETTAAGERADRGRDPPWPPRPSWRRCVSRRPRSWAPPSSSPPPATSR